WLVLDPSFGPFEDTALAMQERVHDQPDDRCAQDDERLWNLLPPPQDNQGSEGKQGSRDINDGASPQHHNRSGNRADGGSRHPFHKGFNSRTLAVLVEGRCGDNHKGITGQKGPDGGNARPGKARHQESNEPGSNYHGAWGNHGDGHRVHKLAVGEPVMSLHNAPVQERNDGQPAAEDEGPGGGEEGEDGPQG